MEGPNDRKQITCECGSTRFYWQTELFLYPDGVHSGISDQQFECVKCGSIYTGWGEKLNTNKGECQRMKANELIYALMKAVEKVGNVDIEIFGTSGLCTINGVKAITDTVNDKVKIVLEKSIKL
jgi:hypothetical protein